MHFSLLVFRKLYADQMLQLCHFGYLYEMGAAARIDYCDTKMEAKMFGREPIIIVPRNKLSYFLFSTREHYYCA